MIKPLPIEYQIPGVVLMPILYVVAYVGIDRPTASIAACSGGFIASVVIGFAKSAVAVIVRRGLVALGASPSGRLFSAVPVMTLFLLAMIFAWAMASGAAPAAKWGYGAGTLLYITTWGPFLRYQWETNAAMADCFNLPRSYQHPSRL